MYITHCTSTCKCSWIWTCTLHTTYWTLYTAQDMFIVHFADLSLHTANIQNLSVLAPRFTGQNVPWLNGYGHGVDISVRLLFVFYQSYNWIQKLTLPAKGQSPSLELKVGLGSCLYFLGNLIINFNSIWGECRLAIFVDSPCQSKTEFAEFQTKLLKTWLLISWHLRNSMMKCQARAG